MLVPIKESPHPKLVFHRVLRNASEEQEKVVGINRTRSVDSHTHENTCSQKLILPKKAHPANFRSHLAVPVSHSFKPIAIVLTPTSHLGS